MIQLKTILNCIDNSGASIVECVKVLGQKRHARIGDRIVCVVQGQRGLSSSESGPGGGGGGATAMVNKVKRGEIRHAVIVRTKKKYQRPDGSVVRFDDNACVLINKSGDPVGTRILGVVGKHELIARKWSKIMSLAPVCV